MSIMARILNITWPSVGFTSTSVLLYFEIYSYIR